MKKILTTAILCAGLVGFTACDSFLDEEPKSSLTLDTYYKTSADIIGNVNYLYRDGAPDKMGNMTGAYRGSSLSVMNMVTGYFVNEYEDNLPAPGRRQPIYFTFRFCIDLCFC